MNRAQEHQEQRHLAQANGHIAELKVQIVRQRAIVKYTLDTGQRSEMAESLLDALEGSLRIFEKHRELIFAQVQRQPPEYWPSVRLGQHDYAAQSKGELTDVEGEGQHACKLIGDSGSGIRRRADPRLPL
jgi:hypothetical protein